MVSLSFSLVWSIIKGRSSLTFAPLIFFISLILIVIIKKIALYLRKPKIPSGLQTINPILNGLRTLSQSIHHIYSNWDESEDMERITKQMTKTIINPPSLIKHNFH
jgi:hypothetical protein